MAVTVCVNGRTVVHADSEGTTIVFPDICYTLIVVPVPIPYPNIALSEDLALGAITVTADGNPMGHELSIFAKSTGDEAGALTGVVSGTVASIAEFVSFSFDVQIEGKGVVRAMDLMTHNTKNTAATPLLQPPLILIIIDETPEIPEQGKVEVRFIDPFGEPMEGVEFETEIDGEKKTATTMSRGQILHVSEKEKITIKIDNKEFGMKEKEK